MLQYLRMLPMSAKIGLGTTLLIIFVAEILFFTGHQLNAIFVGLWAPTLLGFMNYLKLTK